MPFPISVGIAEAGFAGRVGQARFGRTADRAGSAGVALLPLCTFHVTPTSLPAGPSFPFRPQTPIASRSLKPSAGHTAWQSVHGLSRRCQHWLRVRRICLPRQRSCAPWQSARPAELTPAACPQTGALLSHIFSVGVPLKGTFPRSERSILNKSLELSEG